MKNHSKSYISVKRQIFTRRALLERGRRRVLRTIRSVGSLVGRFVGWLVNRPTNRPPDQLTGQPTIWIVSQSVDWSVISRGPGRPSGSRKFFSMIAFLLIGLIFSIIFNSKFKFFKFLKILIFCIFETRCISKCF